MRPRQIPQDIQCIKNICMALSPEASSEEIYERMRRCLRIIQILNSLPTPYFGIYQINIFNINRCLLQEKEPPHIRALFLRTCVLNYSSRIAPIFTVCLLTQDQSM